MRARRLASAALLLAAAGAALALKRFYSGASAAELRFVLAPTAWLVEQVGGYRFDWTAGGYLGSEIRFLIAPACAGVNFLVVSFAALALVLVRPWRPAWHNALLLAASAAVASAATVVANALRILATIPLWTHRVSLGAMDGARLRELAGVVVFLAMLLTLTAAARRLSRAPLAPWIPLLPYAAVTLAIPLLRGAGRRAEFWTHAGLVAGALAATALAGVALRRWSARREGAVGSAATPAPPGSLSAPR